MSTRRRWLRAQWRVGERRRGCGVSWPRDPWVVKHDFAAEKEEEESHTGTACMLQNMVSHVVMQSGFVSKGHGILTEMEHGFVITVVWCETGVVIMSALLETMIAVQDCSLEVEQV